MKRSFNQSVKSQRDLRSVVSPVLLALLCLLFITPKGIHAQRNTPRQDMWVTDGEVNAVVRSGNTLYVGGNFSYAGINTGYGAIVATNLGPDFNFPRVNGPIHAVVSDGRGGWFIGGEFTEVDGVVRNRIARIKDDKSLDLSWDADADGPVYALAVDNRWLYAGGAFTQIGRQNRNRLAALSLTGNGDASAAFNPGADAPVYALGIGTNRLFAAGEFTTVEGQSRGRGAAWRTTDFLLQDWDPKADNSIHALSVDTNRVYIGGRFTQLDNRQRGYIAALNRTTGASIGAWNANANGPVYALDYDQANGIIYAGGGFTQIGLQFRNRAAALDRATGAALPGWNPNVNDTVRVISAAEVGVMIGGDFRQVGNVNRSYFAIVNYANGQADGSNIGLNGAVLAFDANTSGSRVFLGGRFTSVGGASRSNLAAINATTGAALKDWNPTVNGKVHALAISGNNLYVGGEFTSVGGQNRRNIAVVSVVNGATGAVIDRPVDGPVYALALNGANLYVGGRFANFMGQNRNNVASVNINTGVVNGTWAPQPDGPVYALATGSNVLYIGGDFNTAGGQPSRNNLAAVDYINGTATSWNPNLNNTVYALRLANNRLYAGGRFVNVGGVARRFVAAFDVTTTPESLIDGWNVGINGAGAVYSIAVSDNSQTVYIGGAISSVRGNTVNNLVGVSATNGQYSPGGFAPEINDTVHTVAAWTGSVYAGGKFTQVAGSSRTAFAEFNNCGQITLNLGGANREICPGASVTLQATVTGMTGTLTYDWQPATGLIRPTSDSPIAAPSQTTTYTLTVRDNAGCIVAGNITVTVIDPQVVSAGDDQIICPNGEGVILNATRGYASYSWAPTNSIVGPTNIANPQVNPTVTTVYTLTAVSLNGCVSTDEVRVTVSPLPGANAGATLSVCEGESVELSASGGMVVGGYRWKPDPTLSDTTIANPIARPVTTTIYTVTVTGANGCTATATVTVVVNFVPRPTVIAGASNICFGESVRLEAFGGDTYTWTSSFGGGVNDATSPNPTVTPTVTGTVTYYLAARNRNTCVGRDSVKIEVLALPTITIAGKDSICKGQSTLLNASGAATYEWAPATGLNQTTGAIVTAAPERTTTYTITGVGANGCRNTRTVTVRVFEFPIIEKSNDTTICQGQSVRINSRSDIGGVRWSWQPSERAIISDPTIPNPLVTPQITTTFTVTATNALCSTTNTVTIRVNPLPTATIAADNGRILPNGKYGSDVCVASAINLIGSGGVTYNWAPSQNIENADQANAIFRAPTTNAANNNNRNVTITLTVVDANGCTDTETIDIAIYNLPIAEAGNNTGICRGNCTQLNATLGGRGYSWSPAEGLNSTNIANPIACPRTTTVYTLTVTSNDGCSATDTVRVTVNNVPEPPIFPARDTLICEGGSVRLFTTPNTVYTYQWYVRNAQGQRVAIQGAIASAYTATQAGIYWVEVMEDSCAVPSPFLTVIQQPKPIANAGADVSICQGSSGTQLQVTGGISAVWMPADGLSDPRSLRPIANPAATTCYTVKVTDANGCSATDEVCVFVNRAPQVTITASGVTEFCAGNGNSVVLTATLGPGYTYQWKRDGTNIVGARAFAYTASESGIYTVDVVVPGCATITSNEIEVTARPRPQADAGADRTLCFGSVTQLQATGGVLYAWSPQIGLNDPRIANPSASPSQSTTYTVNVVDEFGCSATAQVRVTVTLNTNIPPPSITADGNTELCPTNSVVLRTVASPDYAYQWRRNGVNIAGATGQSYTATQSGTYTVFVSSLTNSCRPSVGKNSIEVILLEAPQAQLTVVDASCIGCLDGFIQIFPTGGTAPYAYSLDGVNFEPTPKITDLGRGDYTLTIRDAKGCTSTRSFTIRDGFTALQPALAALQANVYPNPAANRAAISFTQALQTPVQLQLTDALGRVVRVATLPAGKTQYELELSGVASGVYSLNLSTPQAKTTVRLVVRQ